MTRLLAWLTRRTSWYQREIAELEAIRVDLAIERTILETWKLRKSHNG